MDKMGGGCSRFGTDVADAKVDEKSGDVIERDGWIRSRSTTFLDQIAVSLGG